MRTLLFFLSVLLTVSAHASMTLGYYDPNTVKWKAAVDEDFCWVEGHYVFAPCSRVAELAEQARRQSLMLEAYGSLGSKADFLRVSRQPILESAEQAKARLSREGFARANAWKNVQSGSETGVAVKSGLRMRPSTFYPAVVNDIRRHPNGDVRIGVSWKSDPYFNPSAARCSYCDARDLLRPIRFFESFRTGAKVQYRDSQLYGRVTQVFHRSTDQKYFIRIACSDGACEASVWDVDDGYWRVVEEKN